MPADVLATCLYDSLGNTPHYGVVSIPKSLFLPWSLQSCSAVLHLYGVRAIPRLYNVAPFLVCRSVVYMVLAPTILNRPDGARCTLWSVSHHWPLLSTPFPSSKIRHRPRLPTSLVQLFKPALTGNEVMTAWSSWKRASYWIFLNLSLFNCIRCLCFPLLLMFLSDFY